jgi:hypothetical protein
MKLLAYELEALEGDFYLSVWDFEYNCCHALVYHPFVKAINLLDLEDLKLGAVFVEISDDYRRHRCWV